MLSNPTAIVADLLALQSRLGLSDRELAVLTGTSPATIRVVRLTRLPPRPDALRRIEVFLARGGRAVERGELGLPGIVRGDFATSTRREA